MSDGFHAGLLALLVGVGVSACGGQVDGARDGGPDRGVRDARGDQAADTQRDGAPDGPLDLAVPRDTSHAERPFGADAGPLPDLGQPKTTLRRLFIFQGVYRDPWASGKEYADLLEQFGGLEGAARNIARYDIAVMTHAFTLSPSDPTDPTCPPAGTTVDWVQQNGGSCVDAAFVDDNGTRMLPALLARVRQLNPAIEIFGYVAGTADVVATAKPCQALGTAPSCADPGAPSSCPAGTCVNFIKWVNEWAALEQKHPGVVIDGIFIDLVHPTQLTAATRDNLYSWVKARQMKVMANALTDLGGAQFASTSPAPDGAGLRARRGLLRWLWQGDPQRRHHRGLRCKA
jgi:hypothetical protein